MAAHEIPIRSESPRKIREIVRIHPTTLVAVVFGFFFGCLVTSHSMIELHFFSRVTCIDDRNCGNNTQVTQGSHKTSSPSKKSTNSSKWGSLEIYVPTNPRGAETLPPEIVRPKSNFYLHKLWGDPSKDILVEQKYLVAFAVGYDQRKNIDAAVKKFSGNFAIVLFHYDGRTNEWDQFDWSKRAIHISVKKQTKWWYAKRFLHPDIVAPYDYIFIWDEDLGVQHFDAEKYIKLVKKHKLEISQPAVEISKGVTWSMTGKRNNSEVHKPEEEAPGNCTNPLRPCPLSVEIMAPVFSRDAWRCVWHMIQNDLVHGWGIDFEFRRCAHPAHEKMGVVDSQWIIHQMVPTLGNQGQAGRGKSPWEMVRERCYKEWQTFRARMAHATKAYYKEKGITLS